MHDHERGETPRKDRIGGSIIKAILDNPKVFLLYPLAIVAAILVAAVNLNSVLTVLCVAAAVFFIHRIVKRLGLDLDADLPEYTYRHNQSRKSTIKEINHLLGMAEHEVLILSGSLNEDIWGDEVLSSRLNSILQQTEIDVSIISTSSLSTVKDSTLYKLLKSNIKSEKFSFRVVEKDMPEPHLMIVDDMHVRLEKSHKDSSSGRALISEFNVPLANKARIRYEKIKTLEDVIIINESNFDKIVKFRLPNNDGAEV